VREKSLGVFPKLFSLAAQRELTLDTTLPCLLVQNVPVKNRNISLPPVVLLAALSGPLLEKNVAVDTALPRVLRE